jgi:hypothetical protein
MYSSVGLFKVVIENVTMKLPMMKINSDKVPTELSNIDKSIDSTV